MSARPEAVLLRLPFPYLPMSRDFTEAVFIEESVGELQGSFNELRGLLHEIIGYGSIISSCTAEGEPLHDFVRRVVQAAEQSARVEEQLHERLKQVRHCLRGLGEGTPSPSAVVAPPARTAEAGDAAEHTLAGPALPDERRAAEASAAASQASSAAPMAAAAAALRKTVRLRLGELEEKEPPTPSMPRPPLDLSGLEVANAEGARELILLVDEDPRALNLAEVILAAEDYRVISCGDGMRAMQTYNRLGSNVDLVMLDVGLRTVDGEAVFEEIRALNPTAAVVVTGGFNEPEKVAAMLARGLNGFVPKPYRHEKLLRQVETVLARRRRARVRD